MTKETPKATICETDPDYTKYVANVKLWVNGEITQEVLENSRPIGFYSTPEERIFRRVERFFSRGHR